MSARFNFAIAEAQEKIQDEAFMDKMGIGDYMTVLASGLKEGLQEKERQELEAEKLKKAEDAKLRQKQVAADKLAKEIDSTVNLVLETNGLNTSLAPKLTQILKNNGSANASLAQGYIDSIDNINEFTLNAPTSVDDQMNMIIPDPVFKNPNLKNISGMDLGQVISELSKITKQSNPEKYAALVDRQATLQSGQGTYSDDTFLNKLTRENIGDAEIMLDGLLKTKQIDQDMVQYNRILSRVNQLRRQDDYRDLSKGDPFKNKDGFFKDKKEIELMVNDQANMAKLTQTQKNRGKGLISPPSEKKSVEELSVTQVISERQLLKEQGEKTDLENLRLVALNSTYDALVAAGKINPKEEEVFDVVAHVAGMDANEQRNTLVLLKDKQRLGTLEPTEQQTLAKLQFLDNVDGEFTTLDKRVFKDYSYNDSDKATLEVTIENVQERLANYIKDKSGLSSDRFETYTNELVRLKMIKDSFDLQDKVKENNVSVELTKDFTTIEFTGDPEGSTTLVRLTKAGNFYVVSGTRKGQIVDRATGDYKPDSVGPLVGNSVEATSKLANRNDDFFQKLNDKKNDASKLIQSSYELLEFVRQNEGVLTIGKMASFAERIMKGTEQFFEVMKNTQMSYSEAQIIEKVKASAMAEFEAANSSKANYSQLAGVYDQWISLSLRHAFQFAKLQLGSSGQALSNMDFKNTLTINNTGSTYDVYGANILRQTEKLLTSESLAFDNSLNSDMEHKIGLRDPLYKEVFEETGIVVGGLDAFVKTNNPDAYKVVQDFKTDGTLPPKGSTTVVSQSSATPADLNEIANAQVAVDYMNSINPNNEYGKFMQGNPDEAKINTMALALAVKAYKVGTPTAEMISHAKGWLTALAPKQPTSNN
jgi:hypothetical protein